MPALDPKFELIGGLLDRNYNMTTNSIPGDAHSRSGKQINLFTYTLKRVHPNGVVGVRFHIRDVL